MSVVANVLYIFFIVLELLLFIYILATWLPIGNRFYEIVSILVSPILTPIHYLMERSIFQVRTIDLSPIITFIILTFLKNLAKMLM